MRLIQIFPVTKSSVNQGVDVTHKIDAIFSSFGRNSESVWKLFKIGKQARPFITNVSK